MNTKVYRKIIISMIMLNFYMKLSAPYPMICIITFIYYINNIMITIVNKSNQLSPKIIPFYYSFI